MAEERTRPVLTTSAGAPVADNQHSMTVGPRGPLLLQDYQLIEKLTHQNRERIPERVVHAKGWGAFGKLRITSTEVAKYTNAKLFNEVGKETDLLLRFSTVAGEQGAADAERDVRGFSFKFYTEDGNWDLVGNNTPVFFVRDPYKFPDFIRTQKRHPRTNLRSPTAMWDFWSLSPESMHQITILMSDRGIPKGPQYMNGYGSHTYSFWNDAGERYWCKFHFKTQQGHDFYTNEEAAEVIAKSRESYQEELYGAIHEGRFPKWTMCVQIMTVEQAEQEELNPFDVTKVWPHGRFPLIEVGEIVLDKNPENYFAQVEQAAFSPSNVVKGISFSPDKMLQGRIFSYADAHRYRLGTHYEALPVNQPKSPVNHYHKDGLLRFFADNANPDAYYEPNSFDGPVQDPSYAEPPLPVNGVAKRYDHREGNDDFVQVRALFNLFDEGQRGRLFKNVAAAMHGIPDFIIERQMKHFAAVDPAYEQGVRDALAHMSKSEEKQETQKDVDRMALDDPHKNTEAEAPKFDQAAE